MPVPRAVARNHDGSITNRARGEAMAAEMVRAVSTFFARPDIPPDLAAVRGESLRNAHIAAAHTVVPPGFRPSLPHRYRIADRFQLLRPPGEPADDTDRRLALEFEVERLHREVASRDQTVRQLHAEVATRDAPCAGCMARCRPRPMIADRSGCPLPAPGAASPRRL